MLIIKTINYVTTTVELFLIMMQLIAVVFDIDIKNKMKGMYERNLPFSLPLVKI